MELTNEIYLPEPLEKDVRPEIRKEVLQMLTLLLAPMTPHLAEEMWEMLGNTDGLWNAPWPVLADAAARPGQRQRSRNPRPGKRPRPRHAKSSRRRKRSRRSAKAKADPAVARHLDGKRIVKVIFVPNKLLNLVVQ